LDAQRIVLMLLLLVLFPASLFAGSMEGRLAYRKGDFTTALREFGEGAATGPVEAFFLSRMYLRGEGVRRDSDRGMELLRISADGGYPAAQYSLGLHYLYGHGLKMDRTQAISYLLAAVEDSDYRAVTLLKMLEKGSRGEKKDRDAIVAAVKRKALQNNPDAMFTLAFMYLIGDGVPRDGAQEVRWYRAAANVNPRAAFMLSLMYHYGEGVPRKPAEALRLMRSAAGRGEPRAQYYLGTFYYQGTGMPADKSKAVSWFRNAAENGYAEAQLAYGMLLLSGDGVVADKAQAIEWLGKAAAQNNGRAKEILRGLLTYRGQQGLSSLTETPTAKSTGEVRREEGQLRLDDAGIILDQGEFGLKFSLPTLNDAYAPKNKVNTPSAWEKLQGATFEIIYRPSK
jgi:TPR repeat protein